MAKSNLEKQQLWNCKYELSTFQQFIGENEVTVWFSIDASKWKIQFEIQQIGKYKSKCI